MNFLMIIKKIFTYKGTSNVIAAISVFVSVLALIITIISSIKNSNRYKKGRRPLLSFSLYEKSGLLLLLIKNVGLSEATRIKIKIKDLKNNGSNSYLREDSLFFNEFVLFPSEEVQGIVGVYSEIIGTEVFPVLELEIEYISGIDNKKIKYSREVSFTRNIHEKSSLTKIEDAIESISYSNNRLTNYIEGRTLFTSDKINALPHNSLYKDIKDAINNVEREDETNPFNNPKKKSSKEKQRIIR